MPKPGPKPGYRRDPAAAKPGPKATLLHPVELRGEVEDYQKAWVERKGNASAEMRRIIDEAMDLDAKRKAQNDEMPPRLG